MKILAALLATLVITLSGGLAQAKPDTVELYTEAVMIGDRRYDIEGAAQTGLASVAVGWGYASPGELEAARPGHFVTDVAALRRLLIGPA